VDFPFTRVGSLHNLADSDVRPRLEPMTDQSNQSTWEIVNRIMALILWIETTLVLMMWWEILAR
jgi:hypothetical protein